MAEAQEALPRSQLRVANAKAMKACLDASAWREALCLGPSTARSREGLREYLEDTERSCESWGSRSILQSSIDTYAYIYAYIYV